MKLAEALLERASIMKQLKQLESTISQNLKVQEGLEPAENANILIEEYFSLCDQFDLLVRRINRTNSLTEFASGESISDTISRRDTLAMKILELRAIAQNCTVDFRYSKQEIRILATVNVSSIRKRADQLSKEYRELDAGLQAKNWTVDLL